MKLGRVKLLNTSLKADILVNGFITDIDQSVKWGDALKHYNKIHNKKR